MPVSFSKLRITGFKSFAEPASVDILSGLTGIVGPNGCGKSNIVEALQWAMGESSARGLRGGEMEDVIFAGTAGRPSRNLAEVVITLNDTLGIAPPPFHDLTELEIQRRIERGTGSAYRINGKEARARDVQTLFADLASGARASAMVSQGRVGALIAARPEERRAVLEEAAGITGLHARRHEAELKLRAAEANLSRAEDLKGQLESQLGSLQRQAKQARRYRDISGAIRTAEAELLSIQRAKVERDRDAARMACQQAEAAVKEAGRLVEAAASHASDVAASLPPLRQAEAESRTVLERHRVAQEQFAAEESRAVMALNEARRRLTQLGADVKHADQVRADAVVADARLGAEDATLSEADAAYPNLARAAETEALDAARCVPDSEAEVNRAADVAAAANAEAQTAARTLSLAEQRARRADEHLSRARREREALEVRQVDPASLHLAATDEAALRSALVDARDTEERVEHARSESAGALAEALETRTAAEAAFARLTAEVQALAEILAVKDGARWPPMIDAVTAPAGLETALGAALGEELTSALDPGAGRFWRELPPLERVPVLPAGAIALAGMVDAPPALNRVLSQVGLVDDEQVAGNSQADMVPGQMLVSREGAVWRWDGYTIRAGTPTPAAVRLRQRNRLIAAREALAAAERIAAAANAAQNAADHAARASVAGEHTARAARRDVEQRLDRARGTLAALRDHAATASARLASSSEQTLRFEQEHLEAETALQAARRAQSACGDIAGPRALLDEARAALSRARVRESAARSALDTLVRENAARSDRQRSIIAERGLWAGRARDAAERVMELKQRLERARTELTAWEAAPAQSAARRGEVQAALLVAENVHRRAAETLNEATRAASEADRAARAAEAAFGSRREDFVRADGLAQMADHAWGSLAERILERLGVNPLLPEPPSQINGDVEDRARRRSERLVKERDEMGAVNLRAEAEAEAVALRIAAIETDREELNTAIARLRGSIGHLNREGRERLAEVFQAVDRNFQQLFTRMFGGGRAHLALIGSDDPLRAGLEIYAQPPGKRLSALSLLSGGEQALTALSLIFAVFRCNPAPICVLDEVDAPLDDANVERFCLLLEDIERETKTRFLVVTHHPMTMARMDRLYGVTMQERGVSRLLSVDLARATEIGDQPRLPLAQQDRLAAD